MLDAGHGGKDSGTLGKHSMEKDIVLAIVLKLGKYIEDNFDDVRVIYTRDKDVFIPLHERAEIANRAHADLFISIHANWWKKVSVSGAETYVLGASRNQDNLQLVMTENSVITLEDDYSTHYEGFDPNSAESYIMFNYMQYTYLNQSLRFASLVQNQFRERARRTDRGVRQEPFVVLWRTTMPSVLIETGYVSNPEEEHYLLSDDGQSYIASAIFRAFREYKASTENMSDFDNGNAGEGQADRQTASGDEAPVYFMVQFITSGKSIPKDDDLFEGLGPVSEFRTGNLYKYAAGKAAEYSQAADLREKIRVRFNDAFIIAVRDGEIIPLKDAIQDRNN